MPVLQPMDEILGQPHFIHLLLGHGEVVIHTSNLDRALLGVKQGVRRAGVTVSRLADAPVVDDVAAVRLELDERFGLDIEALIGALGDAERAVGVPGEAELGLGAEEGH